MRTLVSKLGVAHDKKAALRRDRLHQRQELAELPAEKEVLRIEMRPSWS
jgi:hypothetical protein